MATEIVQVPLLQTKLHRPRLRDEQVKRPRLEELLEKASERVLTLVSAPAGYGKSTLISQWLDSRPEPSGWLSLDADDGELREFVRYVVTAVRTAFPSACPQTLDLLDISELPPVAVLARDLSNELDAIDTPFILVLDDYQHITTPAVPELLSRLLQHPPRPLHLVLLTRRDPPLPLAALRARGQLTDVRLDDLRFTAAETQAFLQHVTELSVSDRVLAQVQTTLEGWAAGLHLLVLTLRRQADPVGFLTSLSGTFLSVQDYLVEEVLAGQPPEMQMFLMQIAILDRFCPPLCNAMCRLEPSGTAAFDGQVFTEMLQHENLFSIALDAQGNWFRYHHVFQQLLRQRLEHHSAPGDIAGLHQRASAWFAGEGLIDEALRHALAAEDVEQAAQLVEQNRWSIPDVGYDTLERRLALLPGEIRQQRPELLLAQTWIFLSRLRIEEMPPILDQVESLLSNDVGERPLYGELNLFWGCYYYWKNESSRSLKHLETALQQVPTTLDLLRGEAELVFGLAAQMEGQKETAVHTLNELLYSQPPPHGQRKFRLLLGLIYVHTLAGELAEACTANKKFQALTTNSNYGKAYSSYLQGVIHFYRNELDAGIHCFVQAVDHRHLLLTRVAVDAMAGLSYIYAAMHLPDKVHTTLALLFEYVHDLQDPTLFTLAQSCRARLALMQEDFGAAYQWLETNAPLPVAGLLFWWEVPTITYCRVLVAASSDTSLQEAEKKLQEYLQLSQATHNTCQTIGILLVLALTYHKQARNDEALSVLGQAVLLAQPGGFIRPFLELGRPMADLLKRLIKQNGAVAYVGEILAAFGEDEQSVAVPDTQSALARATRSQPLLVEPLTNREDEILALLGQRLQDKEIATQLFISAETVKSHLKHLYQKLDVRTRRQAVTKAQALGLLSAA